MKSVKILAGIAAGMQGVAILLMFLAILYQKTVKIWFSGMNDLAEINTVPIISILEVLLPLVIYGIFLAVLCIGGPNRENVKALAVVLLGICCLLKVLWVFLPGVESFVIARIGGSMELASYSALKQAISMVSLPFTIVAFALFCFAAGGCFWQSADK